MTWQTVDTKERYLLSKRLPVVFDIYAQTVFPICRMDRLARQVRQDMWRALRRVRGFLPAVEATKTQDGLLLRAGGQLLCSAPKARMIESIEELLNSAEYRQRWLRYAALKQGSF